MEAKRYLSSLEIYFERSLEQSEKADTYLQAIEAMEVRSLLLKWADYSGDNYSNYRRVLKQSGHKVFQSTDTLSWTKVHDALQEEKEGNVVGPITKMIRFIALELGIEVKDVEFDILEDGVRNRDAHSINWDLRQGEWMTVALQMAKDRHGIKTALPKALEGKKNFLLRAIQRVQDRYFENFESKSHWHDPPTAHYRLYPRWEMTKKETGETNLDLRAVKEREKAENGQEKLGKAAKQGDHTTH